ncbi:LysE family translocator [Nitratireductor sp. ZSWI3]|uniref:LysE family translocator n=1 Tax=Nitratireductor sp. ZSWI3 TaxID=2966359 RepID=UPI00214F6354|nr:LysE family translocator [Nitratireductor sp. ZSWI3]MCR4265747.1 LysE family translocator [Nitratireductor sp. ZSWI3]
MTLVELATFTLVAALLVMSPGPNGVLIAKTVPTSGKAAGFANIAGFFAAFYVHGALSILGISIILVQSANAFFIVKMLGAAYLCYIGAKALWQAWQGVPVTPSVAPAKRRRTLAKAAAEGFLTNALNPKVSMFYLAAFPQFIPANAEATLWAFALVVIHSLLNVVWFSSLVLLFSSLKAFGGRAGVQRWLKAMTGAVFIAFGLKLATLRP